MHLPARLALPFCLLTGFALWLSRGVLDYVGTGTGTRVALLGSWPELIGLCVLCGIVLTAAEAVAAAFSRRWRSGALPPSPSVLAPAGALALVAVPYLPWLPDRFPFLTIFGGPLRWWIWGVALALIVVSWLAQAGRPDRAGDAVRKMHAVPGGLAAAVVTLAFVLGAAWRLAPGAIYPGGDEPHYLVITQSLLRDHDLRIDENHARGDYLEYYPARLDPHSVIGPAPDGAVYSIHPIGVSIAVAPGFAIGGYRGASVTMALFAACAAGLLWVWTRRLTGSSAAASAGWLAVVTSAPFVLHGFAIYPEIPAALAVLAALRGRAGPVHGADGVQRGFALAALPWLSSKFAPLAGLIWLLLVARAPREKRYLSALSAPFALSVAAWLAFFAWVWGTPSPAAPYGAAHQLAISNLLAGLPGLLLDQEYGLTLYAPVFLLVPMAWWRLWHRDAAGRRLVRETSLPLIVLATTVGAYAIWWGGSAPPGRELVAVLPLLGVPIAWLWHDVEGLPGRRRAIELAIAVGAAATLTLVLARNGLLIANDRDGSAELLDYLGPGVLSPLFPSFTASRHELVRPLVLAAIWIAASAGVWSLAGRMRPQAAGRATLEVMALGAGTFAAVAVVLQLAAGRTGRVDNVGLRVQSSVLDHYDATARPAAIVFDPWRVVGTERVPAMVRFAARPGERRAPQPVKVLLNMRLALPAGVYEARIAPRPGAAIAGTVSLQVGRLGPALETWDASGPVDGAWTHTFTLDLDASFVGLRGDAAFESAIARIEIVPIEVVDTARRLSRPPVLAAARFAGRPVYFHDGNAWIEGAGFWARGSVPAALTVGLESGRRPPGVQLQMHSAAAATSVTLATPAWSTTVGTEPDTFAAVLVPARPDQRLLPLTITPAAGFVPAEHGGALEDRRLLGCWVEMMP